MKKKEKEVDLEMGIDDLLKVLDSDVKKSFKNVSFRSLEEEQSKPKLWFPTGIASLDIMSGGGLAGGRMSEVYGVEGAGKSTIAYSCISASQAKFPDKIHIIADLETSTRDSKEHMEKMGIDFSKIRIIEKPENGVMYAEDVFGFIEALFRNPMLKDRIGLVVIDSIGSVVSRSEGENQNKWDKDARIGGVTHPISMFLRNISDNGLLYESNAHILCINQVRDNIGDMWNPFRTPGGRKLRHTYAQRFEVTRTRGQDFKNKSYDGNPTLSEFVGQRIKVKAIKNKVGGKEGGVATVDYFYDTGLDYYGNVLELAEYMGVIQGTSWKSLINKDGEVMVKYQGSAKWKEALSKSDMLWDTINYMIDCVARGEDMSELNDFFDPTQLSKE